MADEKKNNRHQLIAGPSSRSVYARKREIGLIWLNRWGYSTPKLLEELLGLKKPAGRYLVEKLVKAGEAREVFVEGATAGYSKLELIEGKRTEVAPFLVMLTEKGKTLAQMMDNETEGSNWTRQLHGTQAVKHNLMCQYATVTFKRKLGADFVGYMPEASTETESKAGIKQPDVLLTKRVGDQYETIALEIELNPKYNTHGALDKALRGILYALKTKVQSAVYLFAAGKTGERYQAHWNLGKIPVWKKSAAVGWVKDLSVPPILIEPPYDKALSFSYPSWMRGTPWK